MSLNDNDLTHVESYLPLSSQDFRVLLILGNEPLHGYGIVKASTQQSDAEAALELGSLYRIINRLERQRLIEETPDTGGSNRKRRFYRATELGRRVARAEARRLQSLLRTDEAMDLLHG
jgi:DNA-binding PadR family transcriptional regulator